MIAESNLTQVLAQYKCNKDWMLISYDYTAHGYMKEILVLAFDVDQCTRYV